LVNVTPSVLTCHCTVGVGFPLAAAVNVAVCPALTVVFAGFAVTTGPTAVTISDAVPEILPLVAVIVELPTERACARPVALIVATAGTDDVQVTEAVRFCVLLSLKVPVAVNCWVCPAGTLIGLGVTAMDCKVAAVTVSVVLPLMAPEVAETVDEPTLAPVARPPAVIVATEVIAETHVTVPVKFCVLLSLKVPVAVNCCVRPFATEGFAGVTAIDCNVATVTVSTVEPVIDPDFALIEDVPVATVVANPVTFIVATLIVADAHVAVLVKF
jgi:hypothetical protein